MGTSAAASAAAPASAPRSVEALRDVARDVLATALDGARTVALVNFPNHGNPGDPAIWLGTRALLAELGVRVRYRSAWWDTDPRALRRAVGDAPVLLNGGGNLGDLYAGQQGTRMRVLRELRHNPVLQLPQSVHFRDPANAAAMADVVAAHGGFRLLVREHASVTRAREQLGVEPALSPDHALGLGRLARTVPVTRPVLWLARRPGDPEHVPYDEPGPEDADVTRVEWMEGIAAAQAGWDRAGRWMLRVNGAVAHRWRAGDDGVRWARPAHAVVARTYDPLGRRWVRHGLDLLSGSRVVVTDKLHGHLLCAMLGIPHVVLDNAYGKVSATVETWTHALPGVHLAADGRGALATARRLLTEEAG
ncbi:polysaccharide pyruvyl transferase family protein [uncultured Cellulomonas sp.]|uniref:polysaccharide pyruvyl transferase family protein n=1 Tax=uncultured Cellulomonas sp. TaxID=189682 RepID=UPI00260322B9|nr:polysaccharide pyruvyl transferase family protein [uncultured Cellulomonas sp.]